MGFFNIYFYLPCPYPWALCLILYHWASRLVDLQSIFVLFTGFHYVLMVPSFRTRPGNRQQRDPPQHSDTHVGSDTWGVTSTVLESEGTVWKKLFSPSSKAYASIERKASAGFNGCRPRFSFSSLCCFLWFWIIPASSGHLRPQFFCPSWFQGRVCRVETVS